MSPQLYDLFSEMSLRTLLVREWPLLNRTLLKKTHTLGRAVLPKHPLCDTRQVRSICTRSLFPRCSATASHTKVVPSTDVRTLGSYHSGKELGEHEHEEHDEDDPDKPNVIKHHERLVIGFSPEQIFDVVMDVGQYNQFVPHCKTSTVISKECKANIKQGEDRFTMRAELVVVFPYVGYKIPYTSDVTGWKRYNEHQVKAVCYEKLFDHLNMDWTFSPGPTPEHCEMDFHVSFAFKSTTLNYLASKFKVMVIEQMIPAFMGRVELIHGKPVPLPCLSKLSEQKIEAGKKERHKRRPKH